MNRFMTLLAYHAYKSSLYLFIFEIIDYAK